jgi:hypothetical protein
MNIDKLRAEAKEAGLYVIPESSSKWICIRKSDGVFLARERSESLALSEGLVRTKFL